MNCDYVTGVLKLSIFWSCFNNCLLSAMTNYISYLLLLRLSYIIKWFIFSLLKELSSCNLNSFIYCEKHRKKRAKNLFGVVRQGRQCVECRFSTIKIINQIIMMVASKSVRLINAQKMTSRNASTSFLFIIISWFKILVKSKSFIVWQKLNSCVACCFP